MIVMYLITQEDTRGDADGLHPRRGRRHASAWAPRCWPGWSLWTSRGCASPASSAFVFFGLWLKRVLVIGALGSAIGLPAALVMILPDVGPLPPESLVEFVLWLWLCVTLGLTVNLGVQLLLSPGRSVDAAAA